jgi:hypothetical protein
MKGRRAMKSPNPPGRPPIDRSDPSQSVTLTLPGRVFKALETVARQNRTNVQTIIRQRLTATDDDDD